ncbi:MAG: hypothetical protein IT428_20730 [Planctomycetaceae bacterium]|nr:hypothetical protein [Planctomycetaceae bacterium]
MTSSRWLVAVLFLAGCAKPPAVIDEIPPEISTSFERLPGILSSIRGPQDVVLREGLPSGFWEPELRVQALRERATIERHGYRLYDARLPATEEDCAQLTAIFASSTSFAPRRSAKQCGGFYPEYGIDWNTGEETTTALISLECGEVKLHSPKSDLYCDLSPAAASKLKSLLTDRQTKPSGGRGK